MSYQDLGTLQLTYADAYAVNSYHRLASMKAGSKYFLDNYPLGEQFLTETPA